MSELLKVEEIVTTNEVNCNTNSKPQVKEENA